MPSLKVVSLPASNRWGTVDEALGKCSGGSTWRTLLHEVFERAFPGSSNLTVPENEAPLSRLPLPTSNSLCFSGERKSGISLGLLRFCPNSGLSLGSSVSWG